MFVLSCHIDILGFGFLLFITSSTVNITSLFHSHRHLANGIFFASSGVGALIMPLIYAALIEAFTVRGNLLIIGGLFLNLAVVATYLTPHRVLKQKLIVSSLTKTKVEAKDLAISIIEMPKIGNIQPETSKNIENESSTLDLRGKGIQEVITPITKQPEGTEKSKLRKLCQCKLISINKPGTYWPFVLLISLANAAYFSSFYQLPVYSSELGLSLWESSLAMSILGGTETLSRIGFGHLVDYRYCSVFLLLFQGFTISGSVIFILSFVNMSWSAYVISSVLGIFGSWYPVVIAPVVSETVQHNQIGSGVAVVLGFNFIAVAAVQPLFGKYHCTLRDKSYGNM